MKRHNTHIVDALRAKFNKPCTWVICCQKGNIHDIMSETAVPKYFRRQRDLKPTFLGPQSVGKQTFLFCGSGAENNSVQTLSCAVSLRKDKAGDAHQ